MRRLQGVAILLILSGCGSRTPFFAAPAPTATPTTPPATATAATATPTRTGIPEPSRTPTTPSTATPTQTPVATATPPPDVCGGQVELVDSSADADLHPAPLLQYVEELDLCDGRIRIEILDGERLEQEVTGGGRPAGAYSTCQWVGDQGTEIDTQVAVGRPEWDRWETYGQGWVTVGQGLYPSAVLLHELYHARQCLITGEIVGEGNWTLEDEYPADDYALSQLPRLQAESLITF